MGLDVRTHLSKTQFPGSRARIPTPGRKRFEPCGAISLKDVALFFLSLKAHRCSELWFGVRDFATTVSTDVLLQASEHGLPLAFKWVPCPGLHRFQSCDPILR